MELKEDIAYYNRLPKGHEQKTYAYLIHVMERAMDRKQFDANHEDAKNDLKKAMGGKDQSALNTTGTDGAACGAVGAGGKGKGKGGKKDRPPQFCWYFNNGGCKKTEEECGRLHKMAPEDEKKNLVKPGSRDRSTSPDKPKDKNKNKEKDAKGNGKNADKGKDQVGKFGGMTKLWCPYHLKGHCKNGDECGFPHLDAAGKEAVQKGIQNSQKRAQSKDKKKDK